MREANRLFAVLLPVSVTEMRMLVLARDGPKHQQVWQPPWREVLPQTCLCKKLPVVAYIEYAPTPATQTRSTQAMEPKKCHGPCPIIDASSKPTCVLGAKHGCTLHPHQHSEGCVVFQSGIPQNQAFPGVWSSITPTNLGKLEMVYGIAWGFYMFFITWSNLHPIQIPDRPVLTIKHFHWLNPLATPNGMPLALELPLVETEVSQRRLRAGCARPSRSDLDLQGFSGCIPEWSELVYKAHLFIDTLYREATIPAVNLQTNLSQIYGALSCPPWRLPSDFARGFCHRVLCGIWPLKIGIELIEWWHWPLVSPTAMGAFDVSLAFNVVIHMWPCRSEWCWLTQQIGCTTATCQILLVQGWRHVGLPSAIPGRPSWCYLYFVSPAPPRCYVTLEVGTLPTRATEKPMARFRRRASVDGTIGTWVASSTKSKVQLSWLVAYFLFGNP